MGDRPTLYRKCPECEGTGGWHGESEFCTVCLGDGYVPVEPVLIVTDDWTPVDSLPEGYTYAIVRLDDA
jgi:hypothetical protein